jgi:DNA-binding FrmR family transcriptional regulator
MARTKGTDEETPPVVARLRRIEGQVGGIIRMIETGRSCESVLTQVMAARAALDRVAGEVSAEFVDECLEHDPPGRAAPRIARVMSLLARTV